MAKKEPITINKHITGCPRWIPNKGGCALPAGHSGSCIPISSDRRA